MSSVQEGLAFPVSAESRIMLVAPTGCSYPHDAASTARNANENLPQVRAAEGCPGRNALGAYKHWLPCSSSRVVQQNQDADAFVQIGEIVRRDSISRTPHADNAVRNALGTIIELASSATPYRHLLPCHGHQPDIPKLGTLSKSRGEILTLSGNDKDSSSNGDASNGEANMC